MTEEQLIVFRSSDILRHRLFIFLIFSSLFSFSSQWTTASDLPLLVRHDRVALHDLVVQAQPRRSCQSQSSSSSSRHQARPRCPARPRRAGTNARTRRFCRSRSSSSCSCRRHSSSRLSVQGKRLGFGVWEDGDAGRESWSLNARHRL